MSSAVSALYERLIERDLDAIPQAARAFTDSDELFLAVARFAILAYAPSLHSKHAVIAALSAHQLRDGYGSRWSELLIEVARYAAESRQPWSDAPILDPPEVDDAVAHLRDAEDKASAEKWLAAHLDDCESELLDLAAERIESFLLVAAAIELSKILGEKGRYATLRMAIWDIWSAEAMPPLSVVRKENLREQLIENAVAEKGSPESVHLVFLHEAAKGHDGVLRYLSSQELKTSSEKLPPSPDLPIYHLSRDLGHHLRAQVIADDRLKSATAYNLEHAASLTDWSFA